MHSKLLDLVFIALGFNPKCPHATCPCKGVRQRLEDDFNKSFEPYESFRGLLTQKATEGGLGPSVSDLDHLHQLMLEGFTAFVQSTEAITKEAEMKVQNQATADMLGQLMEAFTAAAPPPTRDPKVN